MRLSSAVLPAVLPLMFVSAAFAVPTPLAEIAEAIGPAAARGAFDGILARAEAEGPRGRFSSEIVSLGDGTVRFRLERDGGASDWLLAGGVPYRRPERGAALAAADPALASFVRGHELHRMLLDLERRFRAVADADADGCLPLSTPEGLTARLCRAPGTELPERIELAQPPDQGPDPVAIVFSDWRRLHGVRLPFAVEFRHAGERHGYRYTEVLAFRRAPGVALPAEPEALFARLGDLGALAAAHERSLRAHRASDLGLLLGDEGERSILSGRGELSLVAREELGAWLGPYLAATRFDRYEDVAIPVVATSADGSLGWLACQIAAEGVQTTAEGGSAPLAFGFSWVELYARGTSGWRRVGNASSEKR